MTLPNTISLGRMALVPVVATMLWFDTPFMRWLALFFYVAACVSDFVDGYLARSTKQISVLGKMLDPVADKLMVSTVIFMLVVTGRIEGIDTIASLVILLREFLVSSLREFLSNLNMRMHVTGVAKWKTALQMFALGFLIVGDASPWFIPALLIGSIGLWLAALLSVISAFAYVRTGIRGIARYDRAQEKPQGKAKLSVKGRRIAPSSS
ncbi:MAG: CDP-diacylglycerol--glycerol-3-phosphate 3-phosphatidyltransferase [Alphaproteobacteria bacterium GM7ARS4]|nr:CDP-diacylglycerol--glycerol-3-phosphate 3-phosphatidyltransferase [Alphaproteobacteria bacterium GM7ARS4]